MGIETITIDDREWEDILVRLYAYTQSLTQNASWFRGRDTTSFLAGKQAKDYVMEAIAKYLEHPEKFNPELGNLIDYLKYNVIRSLVSNDLLKKENETTVDIAHRSGEEDAEEAAATYLDRIAPYAEALFPEDIDYAAYKAYIESEISGDVDAENIMLGLYTHGMKRREIMEEFKMLDAQYNNGIRRLNTAINKTASHFNEKRDSA